MANALTSLGDKLILQRTLTTAKDGDSITMSDTLFRQKVEVADASDLSKALAELDAWEEKLRNAPDLL